MQALKFLVIFMGLLIVAGITLLAYGLLSRDSEDAERRPIRGAAEASVALPAGCTLAEARAEDGVLVLRSDGPAAQGCQQVMVLDPETGRLLSRITITSGP